MRATRELLRMAQRLSALRLDLEMMDLVGFAGSDQARYASEAAALSRDEAARAAERAALVTAFARSCPGRSRAAYIAWSLSRPPAASSRRVAPGPGRSAERCR